MASDERRESRDRCDRMPTLTLRLLQIKYPVPWTGPSGEGCHLKYWSEYSEAFSAHGWTLRDSEDLTASSLNMIRKAVGRGGGKDWGPEVFMGEDADVKQRNLMEGLEEGVLGVFMGKWEKG